MWDTVIVDCPATGHGVALLETAGNVEELAAGGPIRDQAARIHEVVSHPAATGIVVVARPEELAVSEAIEAVALLRDRGLPVAATVLNGVREERFSADDEERLEAVAGASAGAVRAAARAALRHLRPPGGRRGLPRAAGRRGRGAGASRCRRSCAGASTWARSRSSPEHLAVHTGAPVSAA